MLAEDTLHRRQANARALKIFFTVQALQPSSVRTCGWSSSRYPQNRL